MIGYFVNKARTVFWTAFYRVMRPCFFEHLGPGVKFEGWIDIPQRRGRIRIGGNSLICRLVEFSVPSGGLLQIGEAVLIGRGALLSAHGEISIGDHTMIAEYVCMHDNNHIHADLGTPMSRQGMSAGRIFIGDDCWIGASCIILDRADIGAGSIVGAASLVNASFPPNSILVGSPARLKRVRESKSVPG